MNRGSSTSGDWFGEFSGVAFDGTQPPPPPRAFPDPLAGLVTGESGTGFGGRGEFTDEFALPIAKPVEVDQDAVQAMVEAAMAEATDDAAMSSGGRRPTHQTMFPVHGGQAGHPGPPTPGMVPAPQRSRPTGQQALQALRTYPRQLREQTRQQGASLPVKPSRNSTGVIVAIVLLAVFGIIAIQLISSVVEGLSNTFE